MRVEAYNQVRHIYKKSMTDASRKQANLSAADQLEISSVGRDYQIAKQAVAAAADIREEITAPLKESIQAGTYEVSTEKFADKLLQKMKEMR